MASISTTLRGFRDQIRAAVCISHGVWDRSASRSCFVAIGCDWSERTMTETLPRDCIIFQSSASITNSSGLHLKLRRHSNHRHCCCAAGSSGDAGGGRGGGRANGGCGGSGDGLHSFRDGGRLELITMVIKSNAHSADASTALLHQPFGADSHGEITKPLTTTQSPVLPRWGQIGANYDGH